ncbi:DUF6197 family protein [Algoriphagus halophilus]|uniref:Uncharacterized protein n=1 Tax=Algoriphagus halophilus TaxID=226505 RepID=A0A1N6DMI7_9BACT|nr:hypothetical protein [Algoriphagus halophilus]SIN71985.1 hypothetical protein SAMN05444394_1150 [Algoriphagus halophilus]
MKNALIILFLLIPYISFSQSEDRNLTFDSLDFKIIQQASLILQDSSVWNKNDDRECEDDIENKSYSLFCALFKASMDVTGEYVHRRAGMQQVRFTLEKYEDGRVTAHRLMDWNNHSNTTFEEVKMVLEEALEVVQTQLKHGK